MQQLEIQYFFPLTEQIPLDLDYTDCIKPKVWTTISDGTLSFMAHGVTSWATVSTNIGNPSFTINVDQTPITIVSKTKPNFIKQFIYKSLGMKWKSE
jgi:hypothetical protein